MSGPLAGYKVVDFSRYRAGPWCTQILGDLGAEVVKVERPGGGDPTRNSSPQQNGLSTMFIATNRNKQSVALDLSTDEGNRLVEDLIAEADVLVENFSVGVMERLGIGYDYLAEEVNEELIYTSIKGYGETGPYKDRKGVDLVMQAEAGLMSVTGTKDGEYVKVGQAIGDIGTGMYAAIAVLSALMHREQTGEGQKIDLDLFGTIASFMEEYITRYGVTGEDPEPNGTRHQTFDPYELFETKDGHMVLNATANHQFEILVEDILDLDEDGEQRLLALDSPQARTENYDEMMSVLRPALQEKPTEEWLARCEEHGLPSGPLNKVSDLVEDPHARERGNVFEYDDPNLGKTLLHGHPFHFSKSDVGIQSGPPLHGEHTESVLAEQLGLSEDEIERLIDEGVAERHE